MTDFTFSIISLFAIHTDVSHIEPLYKLFELLNKLVEI